LMSS